VFVSAKAENQSELYIPQPASCHDKLLASNGGDRGAVLICHFENFPKDIYYCIYTANALTRAGIYILLFHHGIFLSPLTKKREKHFYCLTQTTSDDRIFILDDFLPQTYTFNENCSISVTKG